MKKLQLSTLLFALLLLCIQNSFANGNGWIANKPIRGIGNDPYFYGNRVNKIVTGNLRFNTMGKFLEYKRIYLFNGKAAATSYGKKEGTYYHSSGEGSASLGYGSATGDISTAGGSSTASGRGSTAFGSSEAQGDCSVAFGKSIAQERYSSAFGSSNALRDFSAAFGAGYAIGNYSLSFGSSSANGDYSFAGGGSYADGNFGVALGASYAGGYLSTSFGQGGAYADYSVAFSTSSAQAEWATAFGQTIADGRFSTSFGNGSNAAGTVSTAFGDYCRAIGYASTAFGDNTSASRDASTSFGYFTQAIGSNSTAFGDHTIALSKNSTAFGRFNIGGGNEELWNNTDPLFEIGNGSDGEHRSNAMTVFKNGNVGIGAATVPTGYKMLVEGRVGARQVTVSELTSWPDYVFHTSYKLMPLNEVEKYINKFNHLPEVPSAEEVANKGIDLGNNQAALLKKIEELTLYMIEQNKKAQHQQEMIVQIQQEIKELKKKK